MRSYTTAKGLRDSKTLRISKGTYCGSMDKLATVSISVLRKCDSEVLEKS